jgi:hypothetical protein
MDHREYDSYSHSILLEERMMNYKLSTIEMERMKTSFIFLCIFKEHEDLVVFPMHEFIDFYENSKITREKREWREEQEMDIRILN